MEKLTHAFVINNIIIDPQRNQVQHPDGINSLEPKAMALLCVLAGQPNTVIAQEILHEAIWPGRVFSPSSLQRLIALLRKALRDKSKSPEIIFTHAKQGYSLEAAISKPQPHTKKPAKALLSALGMFFLLFVIIAYIFFRSPPTLSDTQAFTFTSLAEFNGQFSPDGETIAFLRQSANKQTELVIRQLESPGQDLLLSDLQIRDFTWVTNTQLLVAQADSEEGQLIRVQLKQSGIQPLHSLPATRHLRSIRHLHKGPDSAIYFVAAHPDSAQTDTKQNVIMQLDLISFELKTLMTLPAAHDIVDLAATHQGLYVSLFENKKVNKLLKVEPDPQTVSVVNAELNGRYKLAWSSYHERLLLLDSLKPALFALEANNQLVAIKHALSAGILDANLYQDKLLTSRAHQTIDVFSSQTPGAALIDSKYEDYLASVSPTGRSVVFVSNRSGYPQLYLTVQSSQPEVIFNNPGREDFISRAIWRPDAQQLVFAADKKVYQFNIATRQLMALPLAQPITRVEYWQTADLSGSGVLYLTHAAQASTVKYHIDSGETELLSGSDHFIYASKAHNIGWQGNTLRTSTGVSWQPDSGKIRHAFSVGERILVQIATPGAQRLLEFDHHLNLLSQQPLPESAQFVSSAFYSEQNAFIYYYSHWQNTDSDLMLSRLTF
ncbi:winged helix-turn-helix domain-containing protein [Pseudoalteromonas sp. OOF1S-7]|uniref:winged helix-turn-helix domain-containing protein n=1 Tax=Pseudoalteromonas sp. OOF1S-7 TaxID=2917757 RepID=UPI001EF4AA76|nr:winged helix-turn-helix domain-containing protein [Pseudoalteromonas sp. OOF1S-7]MCG7534174.1 winged helix-turn-helix domain-containing protein [Pseudoalteromonas sp. OOF1S-7]